MKCSTLALLTAVMLYMSVNNSVLAEDAVREIQLELQAMSCSPGGADGKWGGNTAEAYRNLTKDNDGRYLECGLDCADDLLAQIRIIKSQGGKCTTRRPTEHANGPSIKETQDFLLEKIIRQAIVANTVSVYEVEFVEKCKIRLTHQQLQGGSGKVNFTTEFREHVSSLDSEAFSVNDWGVVKWSTNGKKTLSFRVKWKERKRVVKAMQHLIERCGGKTQLFK